jgi:tRNA (cmo5U34)-methyltransferase
MDGRSFIMTDEEFQIPKDTRDADGQSQFLLWKRLVEGYMSSTEPFSFDTIDDFDDHIAQSIPNYHTLSEAICNLSTYFIMEDTQVIDLGCSTGKLLERLPHLGKKIGIDIADNLLPESHGETLYVRKDLRALNNLGKSSLILSIFTLQFIPYEDRPHILSTIYESLVEGGAFIWAEKVREESGELDQVLHGAHYDFKRKAFTAEQILNKERDLRPIMKVNSSTRNQILAENAGFTVGTMFWKFFNFEAWVYIK